MSNNNSFWKPKGLPLKGEAYSSVALSSNGLIAAVGAPQANNALGQVQIYQWFNGEWSLTCRIDGKSPSERFGNTLALSADGSVLAVATNASGKKEVRVYRSDANNWTQQGSDLHGFEERDGFGRSLALSQDGSTLAIGIPQFAPPNLQNFSDRPENPFNLMRRKANGAVQLYQWTNRIWTPFNLGKIGPELLGKIEGDELGRVVTLSSNGTVLVTSAPTAHQYAGITSIYKYRAGSARWHEADAINGESANENWGCALALAGDGNTLVISTPFAHGGGFVCGQVRVYKHSGYEWLQLGSALNGQKDQEKFGWSVALAGEKDTILVASAYQDERSGVSNGLIRTFQWRDDVWSVMGNDIAGESGEHLGTTVALSTDARTLATRSENGWVRFYTVSI